MPDAAGQQEAQPELGRGQAVVDAGGAEVGLLRGDPDVGRQGEAEPATDGGAVDRRDHRLVQPTDGA